MSRAERLADQKLVGRIIELFDSLIENLNEAAVNERKFE